MSDRYKVRDQNHAYFITCTVHEWIDVFTRQYYRDIVVESLRFCQSEKALVIYAWCLMSNHIHLIVATRGATKLEDVVRDFKKYTSVQICRAIQSNERESRKYWMLRLFAEAADDSLKHDKYKFWQPYFHPIELVTNEEIDQKLNYIHDNPVRAGIVLNPEDYVYSSAPAYAGRPGLLSVEVI